MPRRSGSRDFRRRQGAEWGLFAAPTERLTFDADVSIARARFRDDAPAGRHIAGSLERVASLGMTVENVSHVFRSLHLRDFGGRSLLKDNSVTREPSAGSAACVWVVRRLVCRFASWHVGSGVRTKVQ